MSRQSSILEQPGNADAHEKEFQRSKDFKKLLLKDPKAIHEARQKSITDLGLEKYIAELEIDGYTVVPPEVTGVSIAEIDHLTAVLLKKSEELIGCPFSVENGPEAELDYGDYPGTLELLSGVKPAQFQLMQLCTFDRAFRDLAINPVAVALMEHLIQPESTRFSSHNCFVKWKGDGYGSSLGLHCDQAGVPLPWGRIALNANTNWCLTDYTLENGPLAVVPGSHHRNSNPVMPQAIDEAIPIECPKGSLIAFHGQLWHGAYPKEADGLRVTISNFYRHASIMPQDDIPNHFPQELADDCADPDLFKRLAGFGTPYQTQVLPVPKAIA
ncbi:phytanoyl-CoA dioxygenase family protein [Gammaproteobacteria bacterium]|nr:phytanoyl-CoA dioxygenase family protein [Gammaproteobacteria bacterium]